jgi:hypothetical protein
MSKTSRLPLQIKQMMEYQFAEYDEMLDILAGKRDFITSQRLLQVSIVSGAIEKVLQYCDDTMLNFAHRSLINPEGNSETVAKSIGISKGRGIAWKSQLIYALAACEGLLPEEFTPKMVDEYPYSGRIHGIWTNMIRRCYNPSTSGYVNYGGRGISICKEWITSFFAFEDWAKKNGYRDNLTIDRINNDGNYEPSNCRWATKKQQQNNRRNNVFIVVGKERMTVAEAADKYDVERGKVYQRIRHGWSGEEAIMGKRA